MIQESEEGWTVGPDGNPDCPSSILAIFTDSSVQPSTSAPGLQETPDNSRLRAFVYTTSGAGMDQATTDDERVRALVEELMSPQTPARLFLNIPLVKKNFIIKVCLY